MNASSPRRVPGSTAPVGFDVLDLGVHQLDGPGKLVMGPRVIEAPHDLDVLPRHRLIRQAGCFEGFGSVRKVDLADALAVAGSVHLEQSVADLDSAATPTASVADCEDDLVTGVEDLVGDRLEFLPFVVPTLPEVPDRLRAVRGQLLTDLPDDVRRKARRGHVV